MSALTITLCDFQALYQRLRDVQIIESEGLLIMSGHEAGRGRVVALHSLAGRHVTILRPEEARCLAGSGPLPIVRQAPTRVAAPKM